MLRDVNKLFVFKSLLTMPSTILPLHLKQTFLPIIWIFIEDEGDRIKSRQTFKIFSNLHIRSKVIHSLNSGHFPIIWCVFLYHEQVCCVLCFDTSRYPETKEPKSANFTTKANFPTHYLNFYWRWRRWDQIQAICLNRFYTTYITHFFNLVCE